MTNRQFILPIADELVVDLFAGGGGASTGIEQAIGRHVDIAVNHDALAVAQHFANHPQTHHYCEDVFDVNPVDVTEGRPVGLLWASPDCKHFSKAKGGKPVSKKIRGLAWVVVRWAKEVKPRVICLENVEEFQTWGPLGEDGRPCPDRKGLTFRRWVKQLENLGYKVEWKELRACDYGTPTIRKRLFLVARRDGQPIVWPAPTHAKPDAKGKVPKGMQPWRTAAECIDWSIKAPSIFERDRPLAPATLRRIAHGIRRYVLEAAKPFIVPVTHQGDDRVHAIDESLRTVTSAKRGEFSLVAPHVTKFRTGSVGADMAEPMPTVTANSYVKRPGGAAPLGLASATLIQTGYGERPGQEPRVPGLDKPVGTLVDGQKHALVTANLIDAAHGDVSPTGVKRWGKGHRDIEAPTPTATAGGGNAALVTSNLVKLRGTSNSAATDEPLATVSAGGNHHAEVRAFLIRYFGTDQDPHIDAPLGTLTTKHRDALVTVQGQDYYIADIGMRMLQPIELYRAQGFPASYIIDRGICHKTGKEFALTKERQVRGVGNSVCPPLARAIVASNYVDAAARRVA